MREVDLDIGLPQTNHKQVKQDLKELKTEFLKNLAAQRIYSIFEPDMAIASIDSLSSMVRCSFEEAEYCIIKILIPLGFIKKTYRGYTLAEPENNHVDEPDQNPTQENKANRRQVHGEKLISIASEVKSPDNDSTDISVVLTLDEELAEWYMSEIKNLDEKVLEKASKLSLDKKTHILSSVHGVVLHQIKKEGGSH